MAENGIRTTSLAKNTSSPVREVLSHVDSGDGKLTLAPTAIEIFVQQLVGLAGFDDSGVADLALRLSQEIAARKAGELDLRGGIGSLFDQVIAFSGYANGAVPRAGDDGRQIGWTIPANSTGAGTTLQFTYAPSRAAAAHLIQRQIRISLAFSTTGAYPADAIGPGLNVESVTGQNTPVAISDVVNVQVASSRRIMSFTATLPGTLDGLAVLKPYVYAAGPATSAERWVILTGIYATIVLTNSDETNNAGEMEEVAWRRAVATAQPDAGALFGGTTASGQMFNGAQYRQNADGRVIGMTVPSGSTGQASLVQVALGLSPAERALLAGSTLAIDFDLVCSAAYALPFAAGILINGSAFTMSRNELVGFNRRVVTFEGLIAAGTTALDPYLQCINATAVNAEAWYEVANISYRVVKTSDRARTAAQIATQWTSLRQARNVDTLAVMSGADPLDVQIYARTTQVTSTATNLTAAAQALSGGSLISRAALMLGIGLWLEPSVFPPPYADIVGQGVDLTTIDGRQPDSASLADISGKSAVEFYYDGRISGLTIIMRNGRYGIHRDNPSKPRNLTGVISDCRVINLGNAGARAYQAANGGNPGGVWAAENGIGIGVNSGERLTIRRNLILAPNAPIGAHNINAQDAKAILRIEDNTLVSTGGGAFELASLGSGKGDVAALVGNTMPSKGKLTTQPWLPTDLSYQPADHVEWEVSGHGNTACAWAVEEFGRALRITSASTATGTAVAITGGSAVPAILGIVTAKPGSGGIAGYAYGFHDISGAVAGTSLGARLGDCTAAAKTLVVQINGGGSTTVTFNQNHTAQSNATVLGIINAALGSAATASEYNVGGRYRPRFTDEERGLFNISATGILMGQPCAYADDGMRTIRLMTNADPAYLYAGMAWEDIYPGTAGRVKTRGAIALADFQLAGITGTPALGVPIGVGTTPGTWTTAPAVSLMRAQSADTIAFVSNPGLGASDSPTFAGATLASGPLGFGSRLGQHVNLSGADYGLGVQALTTYLRTASGGDFAVYAGGSHTDTRADPGTGGARLLRVSASQFTYGNSAFQADAKLSLACGNGVAKRTWSIRTIYGAQDANDPSYGFAIRDEDSSLDRLNISFQTGFVGIGVAAPTANLDVAGPIRPARYTVATLPTAGIAGRFAWATNGRAYNGAGSLEAAGAGTGCHVADNGSAWKVVGTNQTVQA